MPHLIATSEQFLKLQPKKHFGLVFADAVYNLTVGIINRYVYSCVMKQMFNFVMFIIYMNI